MRRLLPLALLLVACSAELPAEGLRIEAISGEAPVLQGQTLTGGDLSPRDYAGRVLVVNLWATWCAPCEREQPMLAAAHREAGPGGTFFLGVNVRDDLDAALSWIDEYDVGYPSLPDPDGRLAHLFGAPYLPVTIVIDADGRLRFRALGEIDRGTLDRLVRRASTPPG